MVERVVNNYYKLLDETIQSSTFIVLVIVLLICSIGIISPAANAEPDLKAASVENTIIIDGVEYHIKFIKKVQN